MPVGYVHDTDGEVVIDPDAEVQAAVADVFTAFAACGSAYGVVAAFAGRRFPLRAYGGVWAGQLRWGALTHARVLGVLRNPCYAGAYVHGRYASHRRVEPDGTVHSGLIERPRTEWPVLLTEHHEGYLSWADYLANEVKLAANRTNTGARPPREGSALCQGIILCGSCGKPMRTNYHSDQRPSYECSSRADRLTTPTCRSVVAATVDDAVAATLLDVLTPGQIALALSAADRAERAFHACEPENRLVARTLEARWEAKLAAAAEAHAALAAAQDTLPPLPSRADLERLAADLPELWHAPTTSNKDRKRLLRTVIADITLLPQTRPDQVRIGIRWHTGATDELSADRVVHPGTAKRTVPEAVRVIEKLGPRMTNRELVEHLTTAGLLTCMGRAFDVAAVQWVRWAYKIPSPDRYAAGEIGVAAAAARLGCSTSVVYYWIETAQLDARRGSGNRLCIPWTPTIEAACRRRIAESGHLNTAAHRALAAATR